MKMFLKSVIALVAMVFVMSAHDAQAQCPTGYTSHTFVKTIPGIGNGGQACDVRFNVCVIETINPGPPPYTEMYVELQSFEFLNASCMAGVNIGNPLFLEKLRNAILDESSTFGTVPPCDENGQPSQTPMTFVLRISNATCMDVKITNVGNGTGGNHNIIKIGGCPNAPMMCAQGFLVCLDYQYNPPREHYFPFPNVQQPPVIIECPAGNWTMPGTIGIISIGQTITYRGCQAFCF